MKIEEFQWDTIDGIKIFGKYWAPENEIRGVFCLVHGMGEHLQRYEHLAGFLNEHGIAVIAFDQRGHGKSGGKRGHSPTYDHLMQSVEDLIGKAAEYFPETPIILYGHSMGGNLVLNFALQRKPQINGVIASSPLIRLAYKPPKIQLSLVKFVKRIYPAFTQSTKLDATAISSIEEEVMKYVNDPLVHEKISMAMLLSLLDQGSWALHHAAEFPLPLLIYHGSKDELTSNKASEEFAKKATGDVTFQLFEGAFHEIHNDKDQKALFDLLLNWIHAHL